MSHRPRTDEPTDGALLAVDGVHVGYPGRPDVLDCVSLVVPEGRRLAILGANGSGKTTLLRCLSGALAPQHGTVISAGAPLRRTRAGLTAHRQRVQLVMQDPDDQLFSADVREDISFGPVNLGLDRAEVQARVDQAVSLLGISDLTDRPIHQLSYGQRKRVAIAGAVAMRPRVLLLDEAPAGLDPLGVRQLLETLALLEKAGTTVVMSTHDVDLAWRWADEVAVVSDRTVHHDLLVKSLTDDDLVTRAHLSLPWPVQLLRSLGQEIDVQWPPRTAQDVATTLTRRR